MIFKHLTLISVVISILILCPLELTANLYELNSSAVQYAQQDMQEYLDAHGNENRDHFICANNASIFEDGNKTFSEIENVYLRELKEKERVILQSNVIIEKQSAQMFWGGVVLFILFGSLLVLLFVRQREKKILFDTDGYLKEIGVGEEYGVQYTEEEGGGAYMESEIGEKICIQDINRKLSEPISDREFEVLKELTKGSTNQEIADILFISINTVKTHLMKIYMKLGVKNRIQAVQRVINQ